MGLNTGWLFHLIAFLFSVAYSILFFTVVFNNSPSSPHDPALHLENPWWIVKIYLADYVASSSSSSSSSSSMSSNSSLLISGSSSGSKALTQWGFGVWGYCGTTSLNRPGDAVCSDWKPFWTIDESTRAEIGLPDIPGAITQSLGPASFFLIFILFSAIYHPLALFYILISPHSSKLPISGPIHLPFSKSKSKSTNHLDSAGKEIKVKIPITKPEWFSHYFRSWKWGLLSLICQLIWMFPTLVVATIAVNGWNTTLREQGMGEAGGGKGAFGIGFAMLMIAWSIHWLVRIMIWSFGLSIKKEEIA